MSSYEITNRSTETIHVVKCICGGESRVRSGSTQGYSGCATVNCLSCGLNMSESTGSLGWGGITEDSLAKKVIARWNKVMKPNN